MKEAEEAEKELDNIVHQIYRSMVEITRNAIFIAIYTKRLFRFCANVKRILWKDENEENQKAAHR